MTIYVDETRDYANVRGVMIHLGTRWCHMWSDKDDEELNTFARGIGMRLKWLQDHAEHFHHYDLTPSRRARAVSAGAVEVKLKEWLRRQRDDAKD